MAIFLSGLGHVSILLFKRIGCIDSFLYLHLNMFTPQMGSRMKCCNAIKGLFKFWRFHMALYCAMLQTWNYGLIIFPTMLIFYTQFTQKLNICHDLLTLRFIGCSFVEHEGNFHAAHFTTKTVHSDHRCQALKQTWTCHKSAPYYSCTILQVFWSPTIALSQEHIEI